LLLGQYRRRQPIKDLDPGLEPYIERINQNPDLTTTGSCSGHDGHPYLQVKFRNSSVASKYVPKLRVVGYRVKMMRPGEYYIDIPQTVTARQKEVLYYTPEQMKTYLTYLKKYSNGEEAKRVLEYHLREARNGRLASPLESWMFWTNVTKILTGWRGWW